MELLTQKEEILETVIRNLLFVLGNLEHLKIPNYLAKFDLDVDWSELRVYLNHNH